jgi:peptidoglycan/xylan/chitin deacetylase (PgdA/CDA1 family)
LLLLASLALARELAVTVDDLPWNAGLPSGYDRASATARLVEALRSRAIPAVGFVNCDRVKDPRELDPWTTAGFELGNHSASHMDLSSRSLAAWSDDVRRCDTWLRGHGIVPRWFRYPYLHQGDTLDKRDSAYANITALGLRVAQVSIDNHEWKYAADYGRTSTAEERAVIGGRYVQHMSHAAAHFSALAQRKLGRDIKHVLLLHVNALNADHAGAMLDRLASDGWRFVTLDEAQSDPVYALPDTWVSPNGPSWLHRIEPTFDDELDWERGNAGW